MAAGLAKKKRGELLCQRFQLAQSETCGLYKRAHFASGFHSGAPATVQFSVVGASSGTIAFSGVLGQFTASTVHKSVVL
jgi:hypothetical protein